MRIISKLDWGWQTIKLVWLLPPLSPLSLLPWSDNGSTNILLFSVFLRTFFYTQFLICSRIQLLLIISLLCFFICCVRSDDNNELRFLCNLVNQHATGWFFDLCCKGLSRLMVFLCYLSFFWLSFSRYCTCYWRCCSSHCLTKVWNWRYRLDKVTCSGTWKIQSTGQYQHVWCWENKRTILMLCRRWTSLCGDSKSGNRETHPSWWTGVYFSL